MATDAQIDANRRNAARSTGPECLGLQSGASACTPPTQPPGEVDARSMGREAHEHENATIEPKLQATQGIASLDVMSSLGEQGDDDRTHL